MTAICQKSLPDAPWMHERTRRLPGVAPLDPADWLVVDDAYTAQMAERARILKAHRADVLALQESAMPAAQELLAMVLDHLRTKRGFEVSQSSCVRPDGLRIAVNPDAPFDTLCHLVTEDMCILQKRGTEHVLTAALLCFPASWTLAEKFGHPLVTIHAPVAGYTGEMAKRVQRLFDAVKPGRPLKRANALRYSDPTLYQPRRMADRGDDHAEGRYIRSERQCILRLPQTDAVVFSIQTRQVACEALTPEQAQMLAQHPIEHDVIGGS